MLNTCRNFKFNLRWDFDDPILFSYYCDINDPDNSLDVMCQLKAQKVDILNLFAENNTIFYYDPSTIWRMSFNFKHALENLNNYHEEVFLPSNGRTIQREHIRVKNKQKWLVLEMKQPTLTVIKNFSGSGGCSATGHKASFDDNDMDVDIEYSPRVYEEE